VLSQGLWLAIALGLTGCSLFQKTTTETGGTTSARAPAGTTGPGVAAPVPQGGGKGSVKLPPPETPRSWAEARLQAARRLVMANPAQTYTGKPPDMLLAIPVLTIELNGDGSIRHIAVMRYPSQARETVAMAMDAVKRAAPFGDVSRLPKPWKFNETFLFNDEKKFKPMTLDQR
jgi:hypothetical protein